MVCLPCGINQLLFYIYCLRLLCICVSFFVFPFSNAFHSLWIFDILYHRLWDEAFIQLAKKTLATRNCCHLLGSFNCSSGVGSPSVCVCVQLKSNLPNNKQLEQAETREAKDIRERDRDRGSHFKDDTHTFPFRSGPHSRNNVYQFLLSLLLLLLFFFVFIVVVVAQRISIAER